MLAGGLHMSVRRLLCRIGWHGPLIVDRQSRTDTCGTCGKVSKLYIWTPKTRLGRAFVRWLS
jgi:hypothetical protein